MEYTKGEWKAILDESAIYPEWKILGFGDIIATIESDENQEGNAHLIASTPDMYMALRFALTVLRRLSDEGRYPEFLLAENGGYGFRQISDALEKADGQDYSHGLDDLSKAEGR